jgi:hypothetical protein
MNFTTILFVAGYMPMVYTPLCTSFEASLTKSGYEVVSSNYLVDPLGGDPGRWELQLAKGKSQTPTLTVNCHFRSTRNISTESRRESQSAFRPAPFDVPGASGVEFSKNFGRYGLRLIGAHSEVFFKYFPSTVKGKRGVSPSSSASEAEILAELQRVSVRLVPELNNRLDSIFKARSSVASTYKGTWKPN